MAFVVRDRIQETSSTTGTGSFVLSGAVAGFRTFSSVLSNGDTTYYCINDSVNGDFEVGLGTYSAGVIARTTIIESTNAGSAVDFGAGVKEVFITYPAEKAVYLDASDNINVPGLVDGRDIASDGSKLDGIEAGADVTDTANVTAAGALMKTGGTMTGNLVLNADPTANLQAATKQYVDTIAAAGIHYHDPVRVESPSALTVTYDNGTSGVGATLTNAGTQAALVIDGVTLSVSDRVLIYTQADATQNGVYTVTDVGSVSTNWVMTRATDADSYSPSDPDALGQGDAFFVTEGATGAGELYVCTTVGTITFGTTDIVFSQVAASAVYSAGNGLNLIGTQFNVDTAITDKVDALGTAATQDVGTSAGNVVQLDGTASLPAVDGSQLTGIGGVPSGGIIIWSGSSAAIPIGWFLCDGFNSTPDLRDRFVVGAGSTYAVGDTGGASTVALSTSEMPSHTHTASTNTSNTGAHDHIATAANSGNHTHTGNTSNTGAHSHSGTTANVGNHTHTGSTSNTGNHSHNGSIPLRQLYGVGTNTPGGSNSGTLYSVNFTTSNTGAHSHNFTTAGGGSHAHNFNTSNNGNHSHSFTTAAGGDHTHTITVESGGSHSHAVALTTDATGSGTAHENRPPYYALAYIMKAY